MRLFAAVDIRGGRCVRLHQGDYGQETVYGDDPVATAVELAGAGADWIHVVDLDAARSGVPVNRPVVAAVAAAVEVPVQAGGGVRSAEAARALLDAGVERVVLGTAALADPDLVRTLARSSRVAVGLDARAGGVATEGWRTGTGRSVLEVAAGFAGAGVDAFVATDIDRDGTMGGPDLSGLAALLEATEVPVVASGGVGALDDLDALAGLERSGRRLEGVIVGKALYEGRFTVTEAVEHLRAGRKPGVDRGGGRS